MNNWLILLSEEIETIIQGFKIIRLMHNLMLRIQRHIVETLHLLDRIPISRKFQTKIVIFYSMEVPIQQQTDIRLHLSMDQLDTKIQVIILKWTFIKSS